MHDYFRLSRTQTAYIVPAALYTLWQACVGWLNHYWTFIRLGRDQAALMYVLFFITHASAIAVFAWWLDRNPSPDRVKKAVLLSSVLTALLTAGMAYGEGGGLVLICLLAGLASGLLAAYLTVYLLREIPAGRRGITVGLASALGIAFHFITFTLLFPQQEGGILIGKTFFAAATALLLGVGTLRLLAGREGLRRDEGIETTLENTRQPSLILPLCLILLGFFISFGMQDYSATVFWLDGEDGLVYTRLFLIVGFIGGGLLCDLKGKHMVLNASFSLLALGFVSMAFGYKGIFAFIGFSGVQLANAVFSTTARLVFLDAARLYRRQILVASLGLVFPLLLKQVGIITAEKVYKAFGNMSVFIVSLVAIILALPLVSLLFERLRDSFILQIRQQSPAIELACVLESDLDYPSIENGPPAPAPLPAPESKPAAAEMAPPPSESGSGSTWAEIAESFAQKHGFNRRETQVLELTLHGLTVSEMAENLSLSEPTIKQYVRQMLRKTETRNRRELLSLMFKELNPVN
ncbi:MAG: helix-turn-helix transcriptional regulator [Firmicutes bacterium]|nr:helix-turn-helix transcriptional regulator [Bacillota bacterium]